MLDTEPRPGDAFENLLTAMPRIVQAVNGFTSEENQRTALSALLCAYGIPGELPGSAKPAEPNLSVVPPLDALQPDEHATEETAPGTPNGSARRRARKSSALRPKDIDFRPEGKQSLRDFATEKAPNGSHEMNAVAIAYLQEVLEFDAIEAGHVLAAFIECEWRIPANPENALAKTASMKKWIDTSDMKAIRLTHPGRNLVRYDLPRATKKSA